jgi:hypothetical protein
MAPLLLLRAPHRIRRHGGVCAERVSADLSEARVAPAIGDPLVRKKLETSTAEG